ncbi:MAG: succinoglycan biosynthesis protein ExoM [Frankiaceae bacterium]|nr:succinoglycan biosynthesis protein ExoM [Frankiaceae bacterium]
MSVDPLAPLVVAVLTFRREAELAHLLPELLRQADLVEGGATVLVVDNDPAAGARGVVQAVDGARYVHEPTPGIAAARNRALDEAGDAAQLVFVDDDEWPEPDWLARLLGSAEATGAAAVVGPVVSRFVGTPSRFVAAGRFFDRRRLPSGTTVDVAATNNLLLDLAVVRGAGLRFDERFGLSGGSDTLFTRQLHAAGGRLVWDDAAVVHDEVPAARLTAGWVLRRALRSGNSWSRSSLALTSDPRRRLLVALRLVLRGLVRLAGGAARMLAGAVLLRMGWVAQGLRTMARGAGMVGGATGLTYREYARPTGSSTRL